jgi:hypothetical protein
VNQRGRIFDTDAGRPCVGNRELFRDLVEPKLPQAIVACRRPTDASNRHAMWRLYGQRHHRRGRRPVACRIDSKSSNSTP